MARIVALVVVAALAATPAAALAVSGEAPVQQQAPSLLDAPQNVPQEAPAPAPAPEPDDGSVSRGDLILIAVGVVALIGAIWLLIARDARRATAGRPRREAGALPTGASATRAAHRSRKLSSAEKRRRKRGRAR